MLHFSQLFTVVLVFVASLQQGFSQFGMGAKAPTLKGKIEGTIIDSITKQPLAFATVALHKTGSTSTTDGTLTNEAGYFKFNEVKTGKYDIHASFIGYKNKSVINVETTLKDPDLNIGTMGLVNEGFNLEAVEIVSEKALIENKVDRMVFNAENDASIAGGDATDVLRKVPMLSVDLNGNVSLRGNTNVRILINGKPSGMFSSNVADALKMFPADQIKKVEVITSPSAKYDGEGSGGIINIITHKQNIDGLAGNINTAIGTRQNSLFLNLNAGKGRFGSSASVAGFYSNPAKAGFLFERNEDFGTASRTVYQNGSTTTSRLAGNGNLSAFYDFNGYNSINSSLNFRNVTFDRDGGNLGYVIDQLNNFQDTFSRTENTNNSMGGFDWNTDFTKKFEGQEDRELVVAFQLTKDKNGQDSRVIENHDYLTFINRDALIYNDGDNTEYTFQTDYTHPFKNSIKLEIGGKAVLRNIVSDYTNKVLDATSQQYVLVPTLSDVFSYDQDVYAGYSSLNFVIKKKFNVIAGARFEHTKIKGFFESDVNGSTFSNEYSNLLPNLTISRNLSNFRMLKLSYTKRIQRPSLFYINPFQNNADYLNRVVGNPSLSPELVHQVEFGYNTSIKGFGIFSTLFYRFTDDVIEQILLIDNNLSINTFKNVSSNHSVGLNLFTTKSISKVTIRGGGSIFTYNAKGTVGSEYIERSSYEYQLFINGEYSISSKWKMDLFGFFKSPKRALQGDNPAFSIYGLGIRRDYKNLSIGLNFIEPHTPNKVFESNLKGTGFTQYTKFDLPFRSIGINFRYKFGKVDFKERKTKIKNADLKAGEGDGQGGGNGGGMPNRG